MSFKTFDLQKKIKHKPILSKVAKETTLEFELIFKCSPQNAETFSQFILMKTIDSKLINKLKR